MTFDYRSALKPRDFLTVFNPSKEELKRDFGGNTYTFPPEGTLDVHATTHNKHDREGNLEPYHIPASTIVAHFLGEDGISGHLGPLGVRILSGNPEVDEQIRAEAYKVCKERGYINDLAVRSAHLASVKVAQDAGQPVPSAGRHVIEAFDRIAAYESETGIQAPFKCEECFLPFFKEEQRNFHIEAHHKTGSRPVTSSSSSGEVEALKTTVAALVAQNAAIMELIKQSNERKKPGPKPRKPAEV